MTDPPSRSEAELLNEARSLARENYSTWGHYVIEAYTDNELLEDLGRFDTFDEWVEVRKAVADILEDRKAASRW